jgi:hypothetical protein
VAAILAEVKQKIFLFGPPRVFIAPQTIIFRPLQTPRGLHLQEDYAAGVDYKSLDVIEDLFLRHISCLINTLLDSLLLKAAAEGFRYGIVPTVPAATHTGLKVMLITEPQPVIATAL